MPLFCGVFWATHTGFVINFLTRQLSASLPAGDSVFAYCSSSFAPAMDESLGDLAECFGARKYCPLLASQPVHHYPSSVIILLFFCSSVLLPVYASVLLFFCSSLTERLACAH
jgi:hypothetical protein